MHRAAGGGRGCDLLFLQLRLAKVTDDRRRRPVGPCAARHVRPLRNQFQIELLQQQHIERAQVINIGSLSAYASSPNRGEYCISKAGLGMMTALFADRLAEYGINVYEIRPGIIETDMTSVVKQKYDDLIGKGLTPIQRWGQPDDIGRAVVAIAEGYFPFSTGEVINVDGGFHLRRL